MKNNNDNLKEKNMEKYENVSVLLFFNGRHSQCFLRETNNDGVSTGRIEQKYLDGKKNKVNEIGNMK